MYYGHKEGIDQLIGKTIKEISQSSDEINIICETGEHFKMYHDQDCCESVSVDEIDGYLQDLVGQEVLLAEERTNSEDTFGKIEYPDSFTWTFYTIRTLGTTIVIKWLGESNGYYSESVDFILVNDPNI